MDLIRLWCPVPSCTAVAAQGLAMCWPCWRLVSVPVQDAEIIAFRAWCAGTISDADHDTALQAAVRSAQAGRSHALTREPRQRRTRVYDITTARRQ